MNKDPSQNPDIDPKTLTNDDWKVFLSELEFQILRYAATESPGTGRYLNEEGPGMYCCAGCGNKLYKSEHKFHSGCGWPSFFAEIEENALTRVVDKSLGRTRLEMRCSRCDGHLGHIFEDAPDQPTGIRHCVNGYAVVFVPDNSEATKVFADHRASLKK